MEAEYETDPGPWTGTMTFDDGWHWTVLDPGHKTPASDISNTTRDTMLDTMEVK